MGVVMMSLIPAMAVLVMMMVVIVAMTVLVPMLVPMPFMVIIGAITVMNRAGLADIEAAAGEHAVVMSQQVRVHVLFKPCQPQVFLDGSGEVWPGIQHGRDKHIAGNASDSVEMYVAGTSFVHGRTCGRDDRSIRSNSPGSSDPTAVSIAAFRTATGA